MAWWNNLFTRTVSANGLGKELLAVLRASIDSPSADALRQLARACQPSVEEWQLSTEVFLFHKFLVVQACAGYDPQNIINRAVTAFYAEINELAQTTPGSNRERLTLVDTMWEERANVYDRAFSLDWEEYLENRPGHLPWKRLIGVFSALFGKKYDPDGSLDAYPPECVDACLSVATTFAKIFTNVGKIKRTYL